MPGKSETGPWKKNPLLSEHDFDDKTIKVIYNASAYEKEEDSLIRDFLHYIYTGKPGKDELSNRLSRLVEKCKEDENLRSDYFYMIMTSDMKLSRKANRLVRRRRLWKLLSIS